MNTPICDFVKNYIESRTVRLHMPGHKGKALLGMEPWDITEVRGADSLYEAEGIILESEKNAASLFGYPTYYATEGASQCIRAMLHLAVLHAKKTGRQPLVAAGRNAHKTFLSAAALLGFGVFWLCPKKQESYLSCPLTPEELDEALQKEPVTAVYLTSPDYLGNTLDIHAMASICHKHNALLLVDNAHGAYLKFLPESRHPMDLGADLCCDSAHKTLPALTGAAYLHTTDSFDAHTVRNALSLFGTTSPSYLILQSLDAVNAYLADSYREKLLNFTAQVSQVKENLTQKGYILAGNEPLKITLSPKACGYTGDELHDVLRQNGMECEFSDPDFLVLMVTPETDIDKLKEAEKVLLSLDFKDEIQVSSPKFHLAETVLSIREATLSFCETIPVKESLGRILASASVGCPPAVPIVVSGERIDEHAIACFTYYGIEYCTVVKE